jgi:hypothetical protein
LCSSYLLLGFPNGSFETSLINEILVLHLGGEVGGEVAEEESDDPGHGIARADVGGVGVRIGWAGNRRRGRGVWAS